jgi:hypothetical protein
MNHGPWAKVTSYGTITAAIPAHDHEALPEWDATLAETSARLLELWSADAPRTFLWLRSINAILSLKTGHHALPWYLSIQCGNTDYVAASFANIAARECRSKQAVQFAFAAAMEDLGTLFPVLATTITQLRDAYIGRL